MKQIRKLIIEKETKGTIRYSEEEVEGQQVLFRTVYLRKDALSRPYPMSVTVTVED